MALTATATRKLQVSVESILGMKNPASVIIVPCKPNIMYAVGIFKSVRETFAPIFERLRRERHLMSRMIVYCRTYDMCSDLFMYFKSSLGNNFTEPPNSVELNKHGLVNMFLGCTPPDVKEELVQQFTAASTPLRLIFATSAFGMGVNCCDVKQIIHIGVPKDTESYIQGTGRAGRAGEPSLALLLQHARSNAFADEDMLNYQSNNTICRRDFLFKDINNYQHIDLGVKCFCCDICAVSCDCGACSDNHSYFEFIGMS